MLESGVKEKKIFVFKIPLITVISGVVFCFHFKRQIVHFNKRKYIAKKLIDFALKMYFPLHDQF